MIFNRRERFLFNFNCSICWSWWVRIL